MGTAVRTITIPADSQIIELFTTLEGLTKTQASFAVSAINGTVAKEDERLKRLVATNTNVIKHASISGTAFSVTYYARVIATNEQGHTQPHPYYSIVILNVQDGYNQQPKPDEETALACQIAISKYLKKHRLDAGILSGDRQTTLEPHMALLSQLEASITDQITRTNQYFSDLTDRFDARSQALNEEHAERRTELEDEFSEKQKQLDEAKRVLEEKQRELDDRTNTHARRAIRGELITTLQGRQNSFSISQDTKRLRWPIHAVFILLLLGSALGAAWSLYVWGTNPSDTYGPTIIFGALKSVIFTFTFITTAGLYVSWMNKWFDKHADAQFQTKQFEIDINRASWAVEAALEWKGAQGEQMPDVLLAGITKHLFEVTAAENTEYSPLEALASSILGAASNLKLDVNGNKLDLDRKSIREISKKSE